MVVLVIWVGTIVRMRVLVNRSVIMGVRVRVLVRMTRVSVVVHVHGPVCVLVRQILIHNWPPRHQLYHRRGSNDGPQQTIRRMRRSSVVIATFLLASCAQSPGSSPVPAGAIGPQFRPLPATVKFTHVFSFDGTNGKEPSASLIDADGTLYGTSYAGGAKDEGTVFKLSSSGSQSVLHSFTNGTDGALPLASLLNVDGVLYGTTVNGGGASGEGVVFKITTSGTETVMHHFGLAPDGANPYASLIDVGGKLYGTTAGGGKYSLGTVFTITTSGKEHVLYDFGHVAGDAATPSAALHNVSGVLYGTSTYGGSHCGSQGCGAVYEITTDGKESVLHSFAGGADGKLPQAPLIDVDGTLYGTTPLGGKANAGTVFKITTAGTESILYSFAGGADGTQPQSLIAVNGTLYGTTAGGGSGNLGTVFALTTSGKKTLLYSFKSVTDGARPHSGLVNESGTLFGTTLAGGTHDDGTVFSIVP
jgi:uncharacterized repeat protein (TIGR03803 family)